MFVAKYLSFFYGLCFIFLQLDKENCILFRQFYALQKRRDNLQCMSVVKSQKNDAFTVCFCCEALDLFSARKEM